MAGNRKLLTDADFEEAFRRERAIRVFQDDHVVASGGRIIRYDEEQVVLQSGVSEVRYLSRSQCEFFELRGR